MVISSLVVETMPDVTDTAAHALESIDGVEVHEIVDHKIVVTIEAPSTASSHTIASSFLNIEGVLNVNLVYANFEEENLDL